MTKLDYAVNRYYNAGLGRFTQVDPIGMAATSLSDPQTLNLYAYCGNDPINHTDPDGLFFGKLFKWLGKALKFIFKVATAALVAIAILVLPAAGPFLLLMGLAGLTGLAGWHNGKLGNFVRTLLLAGGANSKYGGFRTPSTFPNGAGVSGVNSFVSSINNEGDSGQVAAELIKDAVNTATNALKNPKCRDLIAGKKEKNPSSLLTFLYRKNRLVSGEVVGARAITRLTGKQATITFDKYIFGSNSDEKGYKDVLGLTTLLGTNDRKLARATLILHELSHATGRNDYYHSKYGPDLFTGANNLDKEIYKTCFEGK